MRLLLTDDAAIVVLGEGQVGSAIVASLRNRAVAARWRPTDWSSPASAGRSTAEALADVPVRDRWAAVWAAGAAGMTSSAEYCERSLDTMKEAVRAVRSRCSVPLDIHLIGSAGAHAVGHPRWRSGGRPSSPSVPYAWLKNAEEEHLANIEEADVVVHRVTSVYGPPKRPGRSGMVTVLVRNASQHRTTLIYGGWTTLRNYVHADDVAASVVADVLRPPGSATRVLAARRSHTIAEVVGLVRGARRRAVPVQLIGPRNAAHITVDPGTIHDGFRSRELGTAIQQMVLELRRDPTSIAA